MATKICRWDGEWCFLPCCSVLLPCGYVDLCFRHGNPDGRLRKRVVVE